MGFLENIVKKHYEKKEAKEKRLTAPVAPGDRMVLYVPGSSVYHLDDWCLDGSAKEPLRVKEAKALKMGLRMCKKCEKNI